MDYIELLQLKEEYKCLASLCSDLTPYVRLFCGTLDSLQDILRADVASFILYLSPSTSPAHLEQPSIYLLLTGFDQQTLTPPSPHADLNGDSRWDFSQEPPRMIRLCKDLHPHLSRAASYAYVPNAFVALRLAIHFFQTLGQAVVRGETEFRGGDEGRFERAIYVMRDCSRSSFSTLIPF